MKLFLRSASPLKSSWTCLEFYQFHLDQQATATEAQEAIQGELARLIDNYGDQTPTDQDNGERRLREYAGILVASKVKTIKVAETQRSLWEASCRLLPHKVRVGLIEQYERLWQQLSGPVYEVLLAFVGVLSSGALITLQPIVSQVMQQLVEAMKSEHDSLTDNDTATIMDMLQVAQEEIDLTTDDALEQEEAPTKFSVGDVVFAKIRESAIGSEFECRITELLSDGMYAVSFDNGRSSTASAADLLTKEQV